VETNRKNVTLRWTDGKAEFEIPCGMAETRNNSAKSGMVGMYAIKINKSIHPSIHPSTLPQPSINESINQIGLPK